MSKKETINNVLKHKRIIIISLVLIGLIIMIMLVYILTYANNKPKYFTSDSNVKITNKCEYFDFTCVAEEIDLKGQNTSSSPQIKLKGKISNTKEKVSDVKVTFEVHTNWTTKTDVTGSEVSFNDGKALPISTTTDYYTSNTTLSLKVAYPVKVMPLVRVKKPTIYAKVTYTRPTPASAKADAGTVTETVYYKIAYSTYCTDTTTVIS